MSSVRKFGCGLVLLFICQWTVDGSASCFRKCPPGQHCEIRPSSGTAECASDRTEQPPLLQQSCSSRGCPAGQVCLPIIIQCLIAPCPDIRRCFHDSCLSVRCGSGTVCNTRRKAFPNCNNFPECYYSAVCEPRAKPRPGICPPRNLVSLASSSICEYDNDCPPDQTCCPTTGNEDRRCTQPLHRSPCSRIRCPSRPDRVGGTCVVRDGVASCADRVCQPGSFFCRDGFQCYCSDGGEVVCTDIPAPANCIQ